MSAKPPYAADLLTKEATIFHSNFEGTPENDAMRSVAVTLASMTGAERNAHRLGRYIKLGHSGQRFDIAPTNANWISDTALRLYQ